ncbi:MAG TPA: chaperone modulator CbpM [Pseudomonadales bacterium]
MSRPIDPELLDERLRFTLREVCRICDVHAQFLMELVDEGVIAPLPPPGQRRLPRRQSAWHFDGIAVVRVQRAVRLQRDLGVNLPGVALALELLDEIEALRQRR